MKALVYNGPRDVRVKEVPDAKLERPTDVLVKITTTNICGSDCTCTRTDQRRARQGAGPYRDFNCLRLPEDAREKETDYVMLADIFPTGYESTELAGVQPGETVVVYGAGPVGLMAAYSAYIKGASKVMVVDRLPDRLALAEKMGAIPVDDSKGSPVEQVLELTGGEGADRGCECWLPGARSARPRAIQMTMNNLVRSVRPTGGIGVIGVFVPEDPKSSDKLEKQGQIAFDLGSVLHERIAHGLRPSQRQKVQPAPSAA